jgi:hypothetical protein
VEVREAPAPVALQSGSASSGGRQDVKARTQKPGLAVPAVPARDAGLKLAPNAMTLAERACVRVERRVLYTTRLLCFSPYLYGAGWSRTRMLWQTLAAHGEQTFRDVREAAGRAPGS